MTLLHAEISADRAPARTVPSTPDNEADSARGAHAGTDGAATLESAVEVPPNGWAPIDLTPILFGERLRKPTPTMLSRADGVKLLYDRKLHWISGEPEGMKSWLAQIAAADAIEAGLVVFYIDFESDMESVVDRFLALGCSVENLAEFLSYHRPEVGVGRHRDDTADVLLAEAAARKPALTIIDGVQASMGLDDLDSNSARDFYKWWGSFGRRLLILTSGPTIAVDHVVKLPENRKQYAAGTGQKQAVVDVHIGTEVLDPFGVGMTGRAALTLQKDRPGMLQRHAGKREEGRAPLAILTMKSDAVSGDISFVIDPPEGPRVGFKPTYLMTQVSNCLQAVAPVAVSKARIESSVHGRADYKRQALDRLIDGGFAGVIAGGKYPKYQFIKPYVPPAEPEATGVGPLRRAGQ